MTNTVQEKVKTDWEKAQKEGGHRLDRIREIVKAAATEAFSELKEGSTEIESMGRQSLAEMIAQLKAKEAAEADTVADTLVVEQRVETEVDEAAEAAASETPAPTWQEILAEVLNLANDRKATWAEQFLAHLQGQMDKFDAEMSTEYGDRYRPFQPVVRGLRSLLNLAYNRVAQPTEATSTQPISIEVLDDTATADDDATNVVN
jgi:hypothetical protein